MIFKEISMNFGFATRAELDVLVGVGVLAESDITRRKNYDEHYTTPIVRNIELDLKQLSVIATIYTVMMFNGNEMEITDK